MCLTWDEWPFYKTLQAQLSRCGRPSATSASVSRVSTPDQEVASRFYEQLFGWHIGKEDEKPVHNYYHLFNHGEFIGGILPPAFRDPSAPPYWQIYLQVSDCDAIAAKAKSAGAHLYMPPMPVEDLGRMAVLADPQGAAFAIFELAHR